MADVIYTGGKVYMTTRAEGSQSVPSNYGVYNSGGTDDKIIQATDFSASFKNSMIKRYVIGGGRNYKMVIPGKYEVDGSFQFDLQNGSFLKYVFGTVSAGAQATVTFDGATITGTPTAALKSYVVSEADSLDSFTMYMQMMSSYSASADILHKFYGVKLNQVSIKADTENPVSVSADWIAQKSDVSTGSLTAPTTSAYSDIPQMFFKGTLSIGTGDFGTGTGSLNTMTDTTKAWTTDQFKNNYVVIDNTGKSFVITGNAATTLTVSGTPATGDYTVSPLSSYASDKVIQCNSCDITLNNNLEKYWSISNDTGRGTKFALEKQRDYEVKLDLNFTNTDQIGRFYSGLTSGTQPVTDTDYTPFNICLDFHSVASGGDNFKSIRIVLNQVYFDTTDLPVNPQDIIKQSYTAFARKATVYFITSEVQ